MLLIRRSVRGLFFRPGDGEAPERGWISFEAMVPKKTHSGTFSMAKWPNLELVILGWPHPQRPSLKPSSPNRRIFPGNLRIGFRLKTMVSVPALETASNRADGHGGRRR